MGVGWLNPLSDPAGPPRCLRQQGGLGGRRCQHRLQLGQVDSQQPQGVLAHVLAAEELRRCRREIQTRLDAGALQVGADVEAAQKEPAGFVPSRVAVDHPGRRTRRIDV